MTPAGDVDNALSLAESGKAVIATFGDMLKVPGTNGRALSSLSGRGLVKLVYSPTELVAIARGSALPVVFLAVGFETTIPTVVSALLAAKKAGGATSCSIQRSRPSRRLSASCSRAGITESMVSFCPGMCQLSLERRRTSFSLG